MQFAGNKVRLERDRNNVRRLWRESNLLSENKDVAKIVAEEMKKSDSTLVPFFLFFRNYSSKAGDHSVSQALISSKESGRFGRYRGRSIFDRSRSTKGGVESC